MYFNRKKRTCKLRSGRTSSRNMQRSNLKATREVMEPVSYNTTVKLFASRSQYREMKRTTAKISKYHILERGNTAQDICRRIINTDIGYVGLDRNTNFNNVIPVLSPMLESFKNRHNRYNYINKLRHVMARDGKKYKKQKYKNEVNTHVLQCFFSLLIHENVPPELFGTSRNVKAIKKTIYRLLKTIPKKILILKAFKRNIRKTKATGATLDIQPLIRKLDVRLSKEKKMDYNFSSAKLSKIKWLHLIEGDKQRIIMAKLLHWFFAQYIIKILHKHIVVKAVKKQWVYIEKDHWCKMQKEFIRRKESTGDLVVSTALDESKWKLPIGTYKFMPSTSGLRALLIVKYKPKERFDDIDIVLRFLQQLYVTYFNESGIPTIKKCYEETLKYKCSTSKPLYYVRCDIQDAFGSVIQEKLNDIISTCCKQLPRYLIMRTYNLPKNRKSLSKIKNVHRVQTVQFLDLKTQIHSCATMATEKPRLVKITHLASKIRKLIFKQKVKVNDKIYLIKSGVSQGIAVSSILADIYYQHMFREKFSVYKNNGFLCTYVDDILYITENKHYAEEFLETVKNGIPEYNVKFNPNKIQSNVHMPYKLTKIKFLGWDVKLKLRSSDC